MKITMKDIKKMILQELKEALGPDMFGTLPGPRINLPPGGSGLPKVAPSGLDPAEDPVQGTTDLESLFHALSAGESGITLDLDEQDRSLLGNLLADYLGS
jgi:hypothetical protein